MQNRISRWIGAGLALASGGGALSAQTTAAVPTVPPAIAADYVHPQDLVDIGGGRKMNLFCMGQGNHTVIFDAGGSDWSVIWALVQPGVAAHARACSYDRAGLGYSDPSDEPRSPIAIVEDLHNLIHIAKISTPVIVVGHSAGGFNMKLYAALYPDDVAGLVLVDPSEERIIARLRAAWIAKVGTVLTAKTELLNSGASTNRAISQFNDCAAAARIRNLDPTSDMYKDCISQPFAALGPEIAAEWKKIQVTRAYQDAQASEYANGIFSNNPRADDAYAMLFSGRAVGDKPLIVLTDDNLPIGPIGSPLNDTHAQTAALSTRGVNRIVPGSHHYIQIDHPQVVIDAIREVLDEITPK